MKDSYFQYDTLWRIYSPEMPDFIARLSETPPMRRLRQVGMNCGCEYVALHRDDMCRRYTRFEHSVGVALIVWHFTHDAKQAIAGLFHDISTPAFAHVVDFLNGDHLTQESTEAPTAAMIDSSSEIQSILHELGLTTADVSDYHRYSIADNASPQLSADRLEYTFGNFIQYGISDPDEISDYYRHLTAGTNEHAETEIVFTDPHTAEQFALSSMKCAYVYISRSDRFTMQYLADLLRASIRQQVLTAADLYTTEENVISRLCSSPRTLQDWQKYCAIRAVQASDKQVENRYAVKVNAKRRYIDPYVMDSGRVTSLSSRYRAETEAFLVVSFDEWLYEA